MPSNAILGEAHTPAEQLTCASVLIYRTLRSGDIEVFVRSRPTDPKPTYSVPFNNIQPGETALECAERLEEDYYDIASPIHAEDLDYQSSAVIDNLGQGVKIRVFFAKVRGKLHGMIRQNEYWKGWQYEFLPLFSLERVYLHPEIGPAPTAIRELLKPPTKRR
ncbi:hypothetical protein F5B22DRAFT_628059 [Xylaria bambusicola]|uniref:uncharacterized protein n=1 Tax=Xylaria bambusicola TaxID=326684 RepID=UPI00200891CB|nr:uncharacterized protein F5B22DRAFT_628059 [Xylaria bambusicola]KAI0505396.1 hypothetical protein F5B22DRAFT_628059 [Xylaria bambusicola]